MQNKKGLIESEISKSLTKWEKEYLGRGSISVKTDILRDMIIVSLQGILTPAEYALCDSKQGKVSIKQLRTSLVESGVNELINMISEITGINVKSFHTDISTQTGERIIVFKLEENIEKKLIH